MGWRLDLKVLITKGQEALKASRWTPLSLIGFLGMAGMALHGDALPAHDGPTSLVALENGDSNGDWVLDMSDGIHLLGWLYSGGPAPAPIACGTDLPSRRNGDMNGDGEIDLSDVVYVFNHLFLGGSPPVEIDCAGVSGQEGQGGATQRPISEFVSAQGTFCRPDGAGGCTLFVPPLLNFLGWTMFAAVLFFAAMIAVIILSMR